MTGLFIAAGIALMGGGLLWLAHLGRTTVEPGCPAEAPDGTRCQRTPHEPTVRHQAVTPDLTAEWGADIPTGAMRITTDFARTFDARHQCRPHYPTGAGDRAYRTAQAAKARYNQQEQQ